MISRYVRPRVTGLAALFAACTVLAGGCSSGTKGHGTSSSPATTSSATASPSPSATADPYDTVIGDPRTADMCAAIPLTALASIGRPSRMGRGNPTACSFMVSLAPTFAISAELHVETQRLEEVEATEGSGPVRHMSADGLTVHGYGIDDGCYRDIFARGVAIGVWSIRSGMPVRQLCSALDVLVRAVAHEIVAKQVRHRTFAAASLTRKDLCGAAGRAGLARIPGGAGSKVEPYDFGTACTVTAKKISLDIELSLSPPDVYSPVRAGRHLLYELDFARPAENGQHATQNCVEESPQAAVPGAGKLRETLRFEADQTVARASAPTSNSTVCAFARAAASRVLDALHVR